MQHRREDPLPNIFKLTASIVVFLSWQCSRLCCKISTPKMWLRWQFSIFSNLKTLLWLPFHRPQACFFPFIGTHNKPACPPPSKSVLTAMYAMHKLLLSCFGWIYKGLFRLGKGECKRASSLAHTGDQPSSQKPVHAYHKQTGHGLTNHPWVCRWFKCLPSLLPSHGGSTMQKWILEALKCLLSPLPHLHESDEPQTDS